MTVIFKIDTTPRSATTHRGVAAHGSAAPPLIRITVTPA